MSTKILVAVSVILGLAAVGVMLQRDDVAITIKAENGHVVKQAVVRADINGDGLVEDDEIIGVFDGPGVLYLEAGIEQVIIDVEYTSGK